MHCDVHHEPYAVARAARAGVIRSAARGRAAKRRNSSDLRCSRRAFGDPFDHDESRFGRRARAPAALARDCAGRPARAPARGTHITLPNHLQYPKKRFIISYITFKPSLDTAYNGDEFHGFRWRATRAQEKIVFAQARTDGPQRAAGRHVGPAGAAQHGTAHSPARGAPKPQIGSLRQPARPRSLALTPAPAPASVCPPLPVWRLARAGAGAGAGGRRSVGRRRGLARAVLVLVLWLVLLPRLPCCEGGCASTHVLRTVQRSNLKSYASPGGFTPA